MRNKEKSELKERYAKRQLTPEDKQERCLNLVRSYLQQNHFNYKEIKSNTTSTSYFYVDIGYGDTSVKIRVSNHDSSDYFTWHRRGYTLEIRSDSNSVPYYNNPMPYIANCIQSAIYMCRKYTTKKLYK